MENMFFLNLIDKARSARRAGDFRTAGDFFSRAQGAGFNGTAGEAFANLFEGDFGDFPAEQPVEDPQADPFKPLPTFGLQKLNPANDPNLKDPFMLHFLNTVGRNFGLAQPQNQQPQVKNFGGVQKGFGRVTNPNQNRGQIPFGGAGGGLFGGFHGQGGNPFFDLFSG